MQKAVSSWRSRSITTATTSRERASRDRASHGSQALQTPGVQPAIHQGKVLTVVDLAVVKARRLAVLEQSDVLLAPVAHAR